MVLNIEANGIRQHNGYVEQQQKQERVPAGPKERIKGGGSVRDRKLFAEKQSPRAAAQRKIEWLHGSATVTMHALSIVHNI